MFVHQIAYAPNASGLWMLNSISGLGRQFNSRLSALAFAEKDAGERVRGGEAVLIRVQGADSVWRSFDASMQGLSQPTARAG